MNAGLLDRFVTDYYTPDAAAAWLPGALGSRRVDGLPSALTITSAASFATQIAGRALRQPMDRVFARSDVMLAATAGRVASRRHAHLYCYANYLPDERSIAPGTRRIVFEYHPLAGLTWETLRADHARFPQTRQSFEEESAALDPAQARAGGAWRRADAVVCASAMTRRSLEHAGCDPRAITTIPYGSPAPLAVRATRRDRIREFLFVGQGIQRKGLHHLIAAWQACDLPDARLTLVCYRADPGIVAMIRNPSIRLLGRQTAAALAALYDAADVFVLPSLVEGFGLVYLEALARGCHVIGTANTGLPDLALPPVAATLIDAGDLTALAAALTARADDVEASRLDRAAIARAGAAWQWPDFRRAIARHARDILGE